MERVGLATTFKVIVGDMRVTHCTAELPAVTERKEGRYPSYDPKGFGVQ